MASWGVKASCVCEKREVFASGRSERLAGIAWLLAKLSSFLNLRLARYARDPWDRFRLPDGLQKNPA